VSGIDGVTAVSGDGPRLEIAWSRDEEAQAELVYRLVTGGVRVVSLEAASTRMQDVYLSQVALERGDAS
jgi:hypothetical protein